MRVYFCKPAKSFLSVAVVCATILGCGSHSNQRSLSAEKSIQKRPPQEAAEPSTSGKTFLLGPTSQVLIGKNHCQVVFVSMQHALIPSHCLVQGQKIVIQNSAKQQEIATLQPLKEVTLDKVKVEPLWFAKVESKNEIVITPISLEKIFWPKVLPLISSVRLAQAENRSQNCPVGRYDYAGVLEYQCDGAPGLSGALGTMNGNPMLIHLGKRNRFSYGLLLGPLVPQIQSLIAQDQEKTPL